MTLDTKKREVVYVRISTKDKQRILQAMSEGELSDITRCLLLLYADNAVIREAVRQRRSIQEWQQP